jgi:hypothetical protein
MRMLVLDSMVAGMLQVASYGLSVRCPVALGADETIMAKIWFEEWLW